MPRQQRGTAAQTTLQKATRWRDRALSISRLSEMVGTSRANMTRMPGELEAGGYVSRATATRDGRRQIATLMAAGRRKVREVVGRIAMPLSSAFVELDDDEVYYSSVSILFYIIYIMRTLRRLRRRLATYWRYLKLKCWHGSQEQSARIRLGNAGNLHRHFQC